jgi:hypothetical protein
MNDITTAARRITRKVNSLHHSSASGYVLAFDRETGKGGITMYTQGNLGYLERQPELFVWVVGERVTQQQIQDALDEKEA